MRKNAFLLLVFAALILNYSCKKDDELKPENQTIISRNTIILENNDWNATIVNVDTTDYTFTFKKSVLDNYSLNEGDILIGKDDGGYLRKITNIEEQGDNIRIRTEFATITEAFDQVYEQASASLIPNKESEEYWLDEGVTVDNSKSTNANLLNLNINAVLYDLDGDLVNTRTDQVRISGKYELSADFDIDINISNAKIENLKLQYEINQNEKLNGYLNIKGLELRDKKKIAKIPCGTIPAGAIIIEPVIYLYVGYEINLSAPLEMGISNEYSSITTVTYANESWKTDKSINEVEVFNDPEISGVLNAKLYLKPEIRFKVYRTVSPYVDAELYAKAKVELQSDNLNWKTSIGLDVNAGVKMQIWKKSFFDYSINLYNWENIINQGQIEAPSDEGTFVDSRDNKVYKWVRIGDQVWMAENLAYMPHVSPSTENGGIWVYGYEGSDVSEAKNTENYNYKGCLYNWSTAQTSCPDGWHIASDEDWKQLEKFLGVPEANLNDFTWHDESIAIKLKSTSGWWLGLNGTNDFGFNAYPSGFKGVEGGFSGPESNGGFWTSDEISQENSIYRYIIASPTGHGYGRFDYNKNMGWAVRCVKD